MGTKKSKLIPALDEQDRFVLLKIKREFSKDESVSALLLMISKLQQEVGILKSEKEELQFSLQQIKKPTDYSKAIKVMQETIYKLSKENEQLKMRKEAKTITTT
jgi:hypothetical protein